MKDWKNIQKLVLEQRQKTLIADWEAINNQINESLDLAEQARLKRKEERLKNEIEDVGFKLKTLDTSNSTKLHILTSAKGGVGKTLISLATVCAYQNLNANLLSIDLNTMNPDLYRILYPGKRDIVRQWLRAEIVKDLIEAVRYSNTYDLPHGVEEFWDRIHHVLESDAKYQDYDVLVDTNLHVANLYDGKTATSKAIERLLSLDREIYIWIIWTWVSFKDNEEIIKAFNRFKKDFGNKIRFIHVLNPTFLVPPQYDLNARVSLLAKLLIAQHGMIGVVADLFKEAESNEYQKELENYLRSLSNMTERLQKVGREIEIRSTNPYGVAGLVELSAAKTSPYVGFVEFKDSVVESLPELDEDDNLSRDFYPLATAIATEYDGRPRNVLVISSHNPHLSGYTDYMNGAIDKIQKKIDVIYKDVQHFLIHLDSKFGDTTL